MMMVADRVVILTLITMKTAFLERKTVSWSVKGVTCSGYVK